MKKYIVYMHVFPNNKVYIGITSQKLERRWGNGKGYKNNVYITNAIKKYGWESIKHEILYANLIKDEAEILEKEMILKYNSNNRKYGYNILNGGNVSNGIIEETRNKMSTNMKKLWKNKEYRERMVKIHSGKKVSLETRKKMSENNAKIWLGKEMPLEIKEKISNSKKGQISWNKGTKGVMKPNKTSFKKGEIHSITKKVKCIEKNIVYNTIKDASKKMNINATCIINVCKGKQKTAGGYKWKYV